MKERFVTEKTAYKLLTLAVLAAAVFFVCRIVYAGILSLPYTRELLEPSNVALTNMFLSGKSPYTLTSLDTKVPAVNYDYPFLNSLLAAAIAKITHCQAVTAHFALSLFCILASAVIGFIAVKDVTKTTVAPVLAALLFMFCHFRFGYISAAPDDLGLMFLLLTSFAATSERIKNKPIWCSIGITLCFYTKQYFVFVAAGLFIYMFLYSKKDAIMLFVWTVIINVIVGVAITVFWPLYWTRAFLFTYLGTVTGGGGKLVTLLAQLEYLAVLFAALFVIIIVSIVLSIRKLYKSGRSVLKLKVKENDVFAMCVCQAVVMMIPLYVLGKNDGAFISYFLQLWMPFVSVVALVCFERMLPEEDVSGDAPEKKKPPRPLVFFCVYAAIAAFTVYFGFGKLPIRTLSASEIDNWKKAYAYTDDYGKRGDIFYSRGLAYDGFMRGNGDFQCGHEGEVNEWTIKALTKAGMPLSYFPYVERIVDQNISYRESIKKKAEDHGYALITFEPEDEFAIFDEEELKKVGYERIDTLSLQFGNMPYDVEFFAPADS